MEAYSIILLIVSVFFYTVSQLQQHGKLRGHIVRQSFWGDKSDIRKYKTYVSENGVEQLENAPNNWYYRFFKIEYKERFPLSATLTIAFTDGEHLAQAGFKLFIALSFAPLTGWIWAGVIWLGWGISFTIFYKLLSR